MPPGGDPELLFHDVDPRQLLRDGVFDLNPRVDFEEVEGRVRPEQVRRVAVHVLLDEELDGAGVGVVGGGDAAASGLADLLAQFVGERGEGPLRSPSGSGAGASSRARRGGPRRSSRDPLLGVVCDDLDLDVAGVL